MSTKERVLSKYEIEYVVEDGGVLYIDGIEYPAKAGRIIVAKPNRHRSCKFPFHCLFVHLSVEDEEIKRMLDNVPDVFIPLPQTNYKMAFSNIIRYGNKTGKNDEYAMISALLNY